MLSREGKQTDRGAVGAEFIGYNRRRREALLLQEFPHQPNCRPSVPAGLNQEIQDFALTVHGTPEIELPPSNYDDHLVQVPAFGRSWPPTLNPPRIGPTEFQDPSSNCLIRDVETTLGKQVLNVPIAQRETAIEPDGMLDDDRWKAVTTVGYHIGHGRVHGELVGTFPASGPLTRVIGGVLVPADRLGTKREPASLRLLRTMIPIRDGNGGNVPVDNGGREGTADFQGPASASTGHSEGRTGYWSQDDPSRLLTSGRDRPAILRRRSGRFAVIRADRSGSRNPDRVNAPPHSSPF